MWSSAAFAAVLDDTLAAAADTFAADNAVVHTAAAADTVVGIAVAAAGIAVVAVGSSVVAHSTAALGIAGTAAVGFVGVYLHPYKHGPR